MILILIRITIDEFCFNIFNIFISKKILKQYFNILFREHNISRQILSNLSNYIFVYCFGRI
jgi:hypothetical protein